MKKIFIHSIAALVMMPALSAAATYYVAKTGSDSHSCSQAQGLSTPKLTVNAGIKCLSSGDTLLVRSGTYTDVLPVTTIPAGSSWSSPTTLKVYPGDVVILTGGGSSPGHFSSNQYYIVWDGFIFDLVTNFVIGNGAHHVRVTNFELKNSADNGFITEAGGPGYNEITHGKIHDNGSNPSGPPHGLYIGNDHNLFDHLEIYNSLNGYGLHLYDGGSLNAHDNIVRDCKIYNNRAGGIVVSDGSYNQVYNNVVFDNGTHGIHTWHNADSTLIYNNTVYHNGYGGGGGYGIYLVFGDTNNVAVKNNISYANFSGDWLDNGSATVEATNLFSLDPLFLNPAGGDFRLKSASPAIDRGTDLSSFLTDDIAGNPRPTGPAFDLGAFEYVNTAGDLSKPSVTIVSPADGSIVTRN